MKMLTFRTRITTIRIHAANETAMSSTPVQPFPIDRINAMSAADFSAAFGPVYEHTPWIAERAFERAPFASRTELWLALLAVVHDMPEDERVALLRAHPELAGKEAQAGTLTAESAREQAAAGLGLLSSGERARFAELNRAYRERFGFPFVICARLNRRAAIFAAIEGRLENTREQELQNAIAQVSEIVRLRVNDLVAA